MNVKSVDTTRRVAAVLAMIALLFITPANASIPVLLDGEATNDSIYIQKAYSSSKYRVKLYPDADHQVLFFSASGREGKAYQLFLFDVTGKLVRTANIRNKETTLLDNMEKGIYLFEVFSNDERIGNGRLFVR
jgi:hypothetical protein